MSLEKYRSRVHMLLLYPDDSSHLLALEKIKSSYDFAGCLHDKDIADDGILKKPHYHIVLRFSQAVWNTAICKELNISQNYIENVNRFDNALQYLIHYNDSQKHQYSLNDVFGNLKKKLVESINKVEKSECEKVFELIEYINNCDYKITANHFSSYCAINGYWAEFRRSASIFFKIIDEHNLNLT